MSLLELERGRALYVSRCTGCHRAVDPRSERADAWPEHVAEMRKRARLNTDEADLVVLYLITMASRPPNQAGASPGGQGARQK
jgi:hypothetical protein